MMTKNKYIVVKIDGKYSSDMKVAIVFPELLMHADMMRALRLTADQVLSAGFFQVIKLNGHPLKVETYGRSVSIGKMCAQDDDILIARTIGVHEDCY